VTSQTFSEGIGDLKNDRLWCLADEMLQGFETQIVRNKKKLTFIWPDTLYKASKSPILLPRRGSNLFGVRTSSGKLLQDIDLIENSAQNGKRNTNGMKSTSVQTGRFTFMPYFGTLINDISIL
jgi:hypothetical protein